MRGSQGSEKSMSPAEAGRSAKVQGVRGREKNRLRFSSRLFGFLLLRRKVNLRSLKILSYFQTELDASKSNAGNLYRLVVRDLKRSKGELPFHRVQFLVDDVSCFPECCRFVSWS